MRKKNKNSIPIRNDKEKEAIKGRVICKKCGKDVEFTKTSELHQLCPRCKTPLDRNLAKEGKELKRIIYYGFFRRYKKFFLFVAVVMTAAALAFNIIGFLTQWFSSREWWMSMLSIPFVLLSSLMSCTGSFRSTSKKFRVFSWIAVSLNIIAAIAIVITSVPQLNDMLYKAYSV